MLNGIEDKFNAFCGWVEQITGRPVIKARKRMNTQLSSPYCTVDLISASLVSQDVKDYKDDHPRDILHPIKEQVRGLVLATFQITALGGSDAMQCIHRLNASFRTDSWLAFGKEHNFGDAGFDGMENMATQFLDAAYENRAQMKAMFYISVPVEFEEDYFTHGELKTTVNNIGSKNVTEDEYITFAVK